MASLGSRIIFSEYNAIQSTIATLIGPTSGAIPVDTGYGQATIVSEQYPFSTAVITSVTNANQATVTTNVRHNLVPGEIIYIDSIGAGMVQLNDKYVSVVTAGAFTFTINLNTSAYTAWTSGQTGRMQQFVISANQFNRLRTDLAAVRKHQTGFTVAEGTAAEQLPTSARNSLITYNIYDSFFNLANTANSQKYYLAGGTGGESTSNQPGTSPRTFTGDWTGTLSFTLEIEWPSLNAVRQWFNTGGYIQFDINAGAATTANSKLKDESWAAILNTTPVNYGGRNSANMGNRPGNWTTAGFYDADAFDREIFRSEGTGSYATNYLSITHRALTEKRIRWSISMVDTHANIFAQAVTADISIAFILFYTQGGITLNYPFSDLVISPSTISSS
jgi:hypothetical protein